MTRQFLASLLLLAAASAQTANTFDKGQVIRRVVTLANPAQSYALYLPKAYDPAKAWPIVIAFDPGALGYRPVALAKDAAEEFGYIVVASNNSRNGPPGPETEAADAVWTDVHQRFSIDLRRTYFAGFSGGSRLAVQLTASCHGCAAGVLASGAAFPIGKEPDAAAPFLYFGSFGREDFNFSEYIDIEPKLKKAGFTYHLRPFDGGHEWAPADVWHDALAWFNLQAMKSGALAKDDRFIADSLSSAMSTAAAQSDDLERFRAYSQIVRDFTGLADVSAAQKLALSLDGAKGVRDSIKREQQDIREQQALASAIDAQLEAVKIPDRRNDARSELGHLLLDLNRRLANAKDQRQRTIAARVRSGAFIGMFEEGDERIRAKDYVGALLLYDAIIESAGSAPGAHIQKSLVYMLMQKKAKALDEAKLAVRDGVTDPNAFSEPAFGELKAEPAFQALFKSADAKAE